ncbi:MAG: GNAT family N-acetyltransferase [Propionibacteriaceae bacterium]|jgi:ribosomal protein S18 acetylase RimI-like enzyme|nr:GNAT family N-acetyltransferase [Propionibacteriaceae bacterium]
MTVLSVADLKDLPAIMALEVEAFPQGWSPQAWAEEIAHHHVILAQRTVVAGVSGDVSPDNETPEIMTECGSPEDCGDRVWNGVISMGWVGETAEVRRIIVAQSMRKQGLGSVLLKYGCDWAMAQKAEEVFLEVSDENATAIRLYENWGFELIATRKDYYRPGDDALVYRWVPVPVQTHEEEPCLNR